jgi:anti-sigma-K factor RskA
MQPQLIDRLAGEYVLGTMHGGARRRFQKLMLQHQAVRSAVAAWEGRLHKLAVSVPQHAPSPKVWAAIEARTRPGPAQASAQEASSSGGWFWRWMGGMAKAGVFTAVGVAATLGVLNYAPEMLVSVDQVAQREQAMPQSYVGLLLDGEGRPSLLVSSTRHGSRVSVKSLRPMEAPAGKVLQVWALPRESGAPFPIGVATLTKPPGSTTFQMSDSSEALLSKVGQLAVSVEDAPVAMGAAPTEPFLLKGHCVKLW